MVAVYSDERSAKAAIGRLDRERFFRSAAISVAENGRHKIRAHFHILFVFAALIAAGLIPPLVAANYSWGQTLLAVGAASVAGVLTGPLLGFALPRKVLHEFAAKVLPGEHVVLAQCRPGETRYVGELLQKSSLAKPALFVIRPYLPQPFEDTLRERELLSAEQLRSFAAASAASQHPTPPSKPERSVIDDLVGWEKMIEDVCSDLNEAVELDQSITPSSEWLLDNAYIIQSHIQDVRRNLPRRYYEFLPTLKGGEDGDNLRVRRLALDLANKTDGTITAGSIYNYLSSYQGSRPLTTAELWVFPLMVRYALIEDLAYRSLLVSRRQHDRERADFWAHRLLSAARRSPDRVPLFFSEITRSDPVLESHFVIRLMDQLSEEEDVFSAAQKWLEGRLQLSLQETIRSEHTGQSRKQVSIANDVTSLRRLAQLDWREIFESVSLVEAFLEEDAVYSASDFGTRDRCRKAVEEIARYSKSSEIEVAKRAIQLSHEIQRESHRNVVYFLIGEGRKRLEAGYPCRWPLSKSVLGWVLENPALVYFGGTAFLSAAILAVALWTAAGSGAGFWALLGLGVAAFLPASEASIQIFNYLLSLFIPPRLIPRMSFKNGIPDEFRTLVAVPTMLLTAASVSEELNKLEVRYLANPDPNLLFALLTDFSDASAQAMPEDQELFEIARKGIADLNARHGDGRFYLFHRDRTWCETENCWTGWERKRGKLEDLNRYLCGDMRDGAGEFLRVGNRDSLRKVRFVITLDSDTELPHDSALHLVEAIAHPLNRAVICPDRKIVCKGYGVIQPRVLTSLPASTTSRFGSIFSNARGTDPYAQAVSDLYQDLFGNGAFIGKAIYDVSAFHQVLSGRFPDQSLLSHDLIEGNYLRVGFDSTIVLLEQFPSNYQSFCRRQHRWIRGDWQIWDWLFPTAPVGKGKRERNPLSAVDRWKIFDNLRRSLVLPAIMCVLAGSWLMMPDSLSWNVFIALALLLPALIPIPGRLRLGIIGQSAVWREQGKEILRVVASAALIPYQAWISLDAIARIFYRRTVSRRKLLEWETAQAAHWRSLNDGSELLRRNVLISLGTAVLTALLLYRGFSVWSAAAPYLVLWFLSPAVSRWLNAPIPLKEKRELTEQELLYIRQIARETWRFFDDLVGPQSNWLPPDNSQERLRVEVACRTSPTNIGLWLISAVAAHDFGYLTLDQLVERLSCSFETLEKLEKHRGHLLNWYDIQTLEPLRPPYVSTVDSGNLLASLWTLDQALHELISSPVLGSESFDGLEDAISVLESLRDKHPMLHDGLITEISDLRRLCKQGAGMGELWQCFQSIADISTLLKTDFWETHQDKFNQSEAAREAAYWIDKLDSNAQGWAALMNRYCGWVPLLIGVPEEIRESIQFSQIRHELLDRAPLSLEMLAGNERDPLSALEKELDSLTDQSLEWLAQVREQISKARSSSAETLGRIRSILDQSARLQSGMDLSFLYDSDRKLFMIGHDVTEGPQTTSHYDLLASEARLTSLIAIARAEVDSEHWQALGRPFGLHYGGKVLLSWSGSMFEYLMPLIFTRSFENSLLQYACKQAVEIQIQYGNSRGVPWGISESAFSALDANQIYQYRAFGVPALGLKRGLGHDLVIAPYATALAFMISPVAAVENLKKLENSGLHGNKGFYEAIDYSREGLEGERGAIVYAYMAHHQGMSFLAMANALRNNVMQMRFHADLRVRATESLLYEGVPPSKAVSNLSSTEEQPPARLITAPVESIASRSSDEKTVIPRTHLLSNGSYSLMITNSGGGYTRWRECDITRWRADTTRDNWGSYCYLRDLDNGVFWSTTYQPTGQTDSEYSVTYFSDRVRFRRSHHGIEAITEVTISPEDDAEIRRITVVNRSEQRRRLDFTTYAELVLAPHATDRAHPAFNKLFVETEALPAKAALLAFRRPVLKEESQIWAGQLLAPFPGQNIQFETGRARFIGRGRSLKAPAAMFGNLSNNPGPSLDPILSLRREIGLDPGERARFATITAAAASRNQIMRVIDKYRDLEAADRAFELAWTHSQLALRYLRIQNEDVQRFQELASHLIYPNAGLRPGAERLRRNVLGQPGLWAFGISGDLPICAVVVGDPIDLGTVREVLQAHAFWHERGLIADLVILNSEPGSYDQPLHHRLLKLIQIHSVHTGLDRRGGVFLRNIDQLSAEDLTLILSAAHVVLFASRGTLARQLSSGSQAGAYPPAFKPLSTIPDMQSTPLPIPQLNYFNGLGGFAGDGREYVIYHDGDSQTPAPWINVLASPGFGALADETGQGFAWFGNSQLNRLTPWHNDPVTPDISAGIYVRDEESGGYWTPAASPIRGSEPYRIFHGQGYTRIEHNSHGLEHELVTFVPVEDHAADPVRIQRLRIKNSFSHRRKLTVTFYTDWVLGRDREETQLHVVSNWDPVSQALIARNAYNPDYSRNISFAFAFPAAACWTGDRTEFLGRNGSAEAPAALGRRSLSGRTGAGLDPCAALQVKMDLNAGQEREVHFVLGQAKTVHEVRSLIEKYSGFDTVDASLAKTRAWWDALLGTIQVTTPDRTTDFLLNRWLLYQTLSCRIWARTALYQSSGAFGFRDQLQDVMAVVYSKPELARAHILRAAGRQFIEGDVQHWWHPQSGAGVRTRCSDDLLWLPYVTAHYVKVTGDRQILEERVAFLEGQPLGENELEVYAVPSTSMSDGTLFEHCRRAVEKGFTAGGHGLPLIGLCDWNDGFNRVGIGGRGESVWLAWFLVETLRGFSKLCCLMNENEMAKLCSERIAKLRSAAELSAWDGEWYRRAYFDDGTPLGSRENVECRIDSLAQSWAVISKSAPPERATQAMDAVERQLIRESDKLVLLFTPPFHDPEHNPGYVQAYPPGVRENGGQYTHAAVWVALALLRQGHGTRAIRLLRLLNPVELTRSPADVARYASEPYVLPGDVYSLEGHIGRGGWTWYTGSSAWMYRVWIEEVLGFKLRGKTLVIDPTIPADWPGFSMVYRFGNSRYRIAVENPEHVERGVALVEVDGEALQGGQIALQDDGAEHIVRIQMG